MSEAGIPEASPSSKPWLKVAVLVVATLAVFAPVMLRGEFFWDDYDLIVNNPLIHSAGGLRDFWFSTKNFDYFPLTSTTFWIEWRLWGEWPQPYHVLNVLLHIGSALMLWRILERLKGPEAWWAWWAALLFAIHPVNVESVAWISERKNTLSMFLTCVSVLLYLRFERGRSAGVYVAAIGAFLLALLAKTAVVMLPVVLLLLAWHQRRRISLRDVVRAGPFFGVSLILGLITVYFQYQRSISDVVVRSDSLASRAATAGCAVWFYLGKAIVPVSIMFNYPRWDVMAYGAAAFVPSVIFIAVLMWLAFVWRAAFVALAGYVLLLLPMLGFLNIFYMRYALVSDHYQYHAVPFVLAFGAGAAATVYRRAGRAMKHAIAFAACVLAAVFTVESVGIASVYRTEESVWQDTLRHNPQSWLAHARLGEMYLKDAIGHQRPASEAISHFAAVTALRPELATGYVNLGSGYAATGDAGAAKEAFLKALRAPVATRLELARAHQGLGSLAARSGDFATAEVEYKEATQLDPESISIHCALGATYAAEGKTGEAKVELRRGLELDPGNRGIQQMLEKAESATSP